MDTQCRCDKLLAKGINSKNNELHFPSDKYNLDDILCKCDYEKAMYGFMIPEENYKKLIRK